MALDIDFGNGDGATSTPTNPENNQAAANEESTPLNGGKETPDITGADGNKILMRHLQMVEKLNLQQKLMEKMVQKMALLLRGAFRRYRCRV